MKVLVVPTWYPSGEDKLMGIYHKEFTGALNDAGIEANMLFIDRQRLSKPFSYLFMKKHLVEKERNYKVYIQRMLNLRPISFDMQMKSYVKVFNKTLEKYIKEYGKPDIIHAMVSVPAGYAACQNKYNIPVIVTEHGGLVERLYKDEPYKKYGEFVLEHATVSTVSTYMRDIVLKYTDYCAVIPNQINTKLFKNDITRKIEGEFKLISVCALREGKNLDMAFKAIKILRDEGINIKYRIIGEGFLESHYKEASTDLGVSDYVEFLGKKDKSEIAEYLKDSHALLISSDLESFAIPGIEALASGIPVISTDCLGPRDFIDNTVGRLAKVGDEVDFAKKIKEVYENYDKFDKKHLESVAEKFSEQSAANKAIKEYQKILNKDKN